ncbi:hypothetical protein M433DRAFT_7834 [Acidomyces richmondensis BFW]|nr:hypothetical protein M433DRAFT_7834 [Acidomyces richmondensis BFW]
MAPTSDRIIIGVDFGTTFSGVAEAYSGTPVAANEINVIKTWPRGNNVTSDKVPSEITYVQTTSASEEISSCRTVQKWTCSCAVRVEARIYGSGIISY